MSFVIRLKSKIETSSFWADRNKRILVVAFLLSLLFHAVLFLFLNFDGLLTPNLTELEKSQPEQVTIVFPENKPKPKAKEWKIVENINENNEVPQKTDLLSDKNSRAKNPEAGKAIGATPKSNGNAPIRDFSPAPSFKAFSSPTTKPFTKEALLGEHLAENASPAEERRRKKAQLQSTPAPGANQMMQQKDFSVEDLGAISLSTYKWEWAPYVNALKHKLYQVWFAPPAYYQLGLIHGYTVVRFTIDRQGHMTHLEVLKQVGHKSLQLSSTEAIKALFPFLPLPQDFPEKDLTITAKLIYPDLRQGR